jgi:hypothetical protein
MARCAHREGRFHGHRETVLRQRLADPPFRLELVALVEVTIRLEVTGDRLAHADAGRPHLIERFGQ